MNDFRPIRLALKTIRNSRTHTDQAVANRATELWRIFTMGLPAVQAHVDVIQSAQSTAAQKIAALEILTWFVMNSGIQPRP